MPSKISDVNRTLTGADISDNLAEIQGNIIKPYMFARQRGLFFKIDHGEPGRRWLGGLAERVTSAADSPEEDRPASALNVGISHFGLQALEPSDNALQSFPPEFQAGAVGRAQILGDVGELAPENWEDGFGGKDIHVAVFVFANSEEEIESQSKWVRDIAKEAGGVTEMAAHDAYAYEDGVEHFGYRDGLTDVPIEGTEEIYPQNPGGGTRRPDGSWDAIKPGEFLLGYESETGSEPPSPMPRELAVNGTYIVYRKIYQNVAAFRKFLIDGAMSIYGSDKEINQERLAAKMMGRWRSGCPLMASPDKDDPSLVDDPVKRNDFGYAEDPDGMIVPRGAHIRRMNPRDALDGTATVVRRHRLIRRGLDYGPKLPEGCLEDDGADRGIAAYMVMADIKGQFEFVWKQWVNQGDFASLPVGEQDPIIGPGTGEQSMTLPSEPMPFLFNLTRFITPKCSEYFFMPSITALRGIAQQKY